MFARLASLLRSLLPDPERTGLGWWLIAIQTAIVLLVGGGIAWYASGMLHQLADEQGKARVQLAATTAREDLRRIGEDAHATARALADRPTLQRLLAEGQNEALPPFLRHWCEVGNVDACAVLSGKSVVAVSGPPLDWQQIVTASAEQGGTFMTLSTTEHVPLLGARATLSDGGLTVYVVRLLDAKLARTLSEQVGAQINLIDYRAYTGGAVTAFTPLYSAALADGHSAVLRIDSQELYAASTPVFASSGEAMALIEARLPASAVDAPTRHLVHKLLVAALVLGSLAVLAGVLLGELVAGPVRALTAAARRLSAGDFSASIPPGGAAEVGVLAHTMEDMRRNLIDLTSTLRRSEAEAQAVLGGIVEGVYAVDKNRIIRYLNPQAARLLGVAPADAVGRFCGDVLKPQEEDGRRPCELRCPILQAARAGQHQDHRGAARAWRATRHRHHQRRPGRTDCRCRSSATRPSLRRCGARATRCSPTSRMSSARRSPPQLASIELLLAGLDTMTPQQLRALVASLERGTLRLTQLIDNLLESVRIESGQLAIRSQSVTLAEVVEDAQVLVGSLLAQRGQHLLIELADELPPITGDKTRLTQVFVNLLANANKFAPEGSSVRIGARREGAFVRAWVEDEGPGPAANEGDTLFARFRRGAQEPEPAGLGLGLWIVQSIIERHGGAVSFERTASERTRFSFTLPVESL